MYSNQKGNTELLKDVNEMQYMLETYLDFSQTASSEEDTEVDLKELIDNIISTSNEKSKIISLKPTNLKNIKYICKKIALKSAV